MSTRRTASSDQVTSRISAARIARMAIASVLGATFVLGIAVTAVARSRPITPADDCLAELAAPLILERGLDEVRIGVDPRLEGGTMAQVEMITPNVVRIATGAASWCGGPYNEDLRAVISHELGHVEQYALGADPVRVALLRHRLEAVYGDDADALEGAANCAAELQLGINISAYVPGPGVCTPAMLDAAQSISDGRWPA